MRDTFRSSVLVAIVFLFVSASGDRLLAQAASPASPGGDPAGLLVKTLKEKFALTDFSSDYQQIVTAGAVVALKVDGHVSDYIADPNRPRNGLVVFRLPLKYCPITTYKKGTLSMGFGDSSDAASGNNLGINEFFSFPRKYLQIGDKFWIDGFSIDRNSIRVYVTTDLYDDGRYCGTLKFPFEKGHLPAPDDAVKMISEVLAVQPAQEPLAQIEPVAAAESEPAPLAEEISTDVGARNGSVSDQAKPVLDRAIRFLGGIENIRALKDIESRWQQTAITQKGNIEVQGNSIMVYPGIRRSGYKMSLGEKSTSVESFFDGTNGWMIQDGKPIEMNEDQKKSARHDVFDELPNLLGLTGGPTVTYEGKNGGNDVLVFRQEDLSVRLQIDSTGQVVKQAYHKKTDDLEDTFSDYREVGGVKRAFKDSVTRNGQKFVEQQITEMTANTNPSLETLAQKPGDQKLSATYLATITPLKVPALYVSAQSPTDQLRLNADNSFLLREAGQPYHGTFVTRGSTLLLNISETNIQTTLSRQGQDLADSSGQTWNWRDQSASPVSSAKAPGGTALKNGDIIKLAKVGIDDATIIAKINGSNCQFDTSTDALIQLKHGGVSASVLKAMVGTGK